MKLDCEGEMIMIEILIHTLFLGKIGMFIQERLAKVNASKGEDTFNGLDLARVLRQYFLKSY
jgi:hypothetical protein